MIETRLRLDLLSVTLSLLPSRSSGEAQMEVEGSPEEEKEEDGWQFGIGENGRRSRRNHMCVCVCDRRKGGKRDFFFSPPRVSCDSFSASSSRVSTPENE